MEELRVCDDGEIHGTLRPDDARIRALRKRRDCPGLVHVISASVAQYAAAGEDDAKRVLRAAIVRSAEPSPRAHERESRFAPRSHPAATAPVTSRGKATGGSPVSQ